MLKTIKALALAGAMLPLAQGAAAQPAGAGTFVEVPGGKLWTQTCGTGPQAMVLLHDGMLHSIGWDDVWPALCKSFHVVRYDRRGYGRSPEAKAAYSEVEDVAAVMRAAGMDHAVIVGASHGGGIAIDFTLAHPEQVDRLVAVGPEVSGLPRSQHFLDRTAESMAKMGHLDLMGAIKSSWELAPGHTAMANRLLGLLLANSQDLSHRDPATPPPPAAPRLGAIKVPTLVITGESDVADNQAQAGVVEYAVPGARRVVVRDAAHLVFIEQPAEFAGLVTRFAQERPDAAAPGAEEALARDRGGPGRRHRLQPHGPGGGRRDTRAQRRDPGHFRQARPAQVSDLPGQGRAGRRHLSGRVREGQD
jgi:3-oxoadipate enol-lactonase